MLSLGDLFNPLALSGQCPDLARRHVLMRSVLQVMTGGDGPWPHDDPVWASLLPLIPQGTRRSTITPHDPQHLTFSAPLTVPPDQLGQLITLPWILGGHSVPVLGEVIWHQPLTVQISRERYTQAGQPIPAFLRAYDGLRLLGVTPTEAQIFVKHTPGDLLLEVVTLAYRRRAQVRSPQGYVKGLLVHRLAQHARGSQPPNMGNCGDASPPPLPHSAHGSTRPAVPS